MYLVSILESIVNHNCVYDSCDISACHQINEDSESYNFSCEWRIERKHVLWLYCLCDHPWQAGNSRSPQHPQGLNALGSRNNRFRGIICPAGAARGVHPPWGNDVHIFPPCFRFPPISEKFFRLRGKFPQIDLFPKMFRFSSAKISADLLFIHWLMATNFEFPPCFRCFSTFPPYFEKNYPFLPTFANILPWFRKFTCFDILYVFFVSPYFDYDAFMHHTMHVLDAPGCGVGKLAFL